MEQILITQPAWLQALVTGLAMLLGWRAGRWLGSRMSAHHSESSASSPRDAASKFEAANFALLGLLLAFTFSMSLSKHEQRRLMVVADSNAIADFYTCVSLLKEPVRTKLHTVIREYTELRLRAARERLDQNTWEDLLRRSRFMHAEMTELVLEAVSNGTPIAVSLTNTLNEVTSNHAARVAAIEDRVPQSVVFLLFTFAVVTTLLSGVEQGARGMPSRLEVLGMLSFVVLVTLAVYVTLDLNQPERGLIRITQAPIERLLSSMAK